MGPDPRMMLPHSLADDLIDQHHRPTKNGVMQNQQPYLESTGLAKSCGRSGTLLLQTARQYYVTGYTKDDVSLEILI